MIKQLVVWGGNEGGQDSLRWIQKSFHESARKIGIPSRWVPDMENSIYALQEGVTVIAADVWNKHLIHRPNIDYVVHNFNQDHPVMQHTDPRNLLRLQVWTNDAFGEEWAPCRQYSHEGRVLFQPWGTDLLAEEFNDPVFNPLSREVVFVGAVWSHIDEYGKDMGNTEEIHELREVTKEQGLTFRHLTQVSEKENMLAVRAARLAPAVAGKWQAEHNYLPCRAFKNASYGAAMFTNVPMINEIFGDSAVKGTTISQLVTNAIRMNRDAYEKTVRAQQRVAANYTPRESLLAIARALEEGK